MKLQTAAAIGAAETRLPSSVASIKAQFWGLL